MTDRMIIFGKAPVSHRSALKRFLRGYKQCIYSQHPHADNRLIWSWSAFFSLTRVFPERLRPSPASFITYAMFYMHFISQITKNRPHCMENSALPYTFFILQGLKLHPAVNYSYIYFNEKLEDSWSYNSQNFSYDDTAL